MVRLLLFSNNNNNNTIIPILFDRFYECVDQDQVRVNRSIVQNKSDCLSMNETHNFTWTRPDINFDNALIAYLALLQIVCIYAGITNALYMIIILMKKPIGMYGCSRHDIQVQCVIDVCYFAI